MQDRTGKQIKRLQLVDFFYTGALQGRIIQCQDIPVVQGKQASPPQIVIQVLIHKMPAENGELDVYIIEDSPLKPEAPKIELVQ